MPAAPHVESHFTASATVRDVVIGMADGLTVPFALAAGISGALAASANATRLVVTRDSRKLRPGRLPWGWAATWRPRRTPNTMPPNGNAKSAKPWNSRTSKRKRWLRFFGNTD